MKRKLIPLAANVAGGAILAFGLYHIHSFSGVSEGGQLGLTLLLQHWFSISPAYTSLIMNIIFYAIGWKTMGKDFLLYTAAAALTFSGVYRVCQCFPPLWPEFINYPLAAALLGALFIGGGTGLCVRFGGAPSGDDALVMSLHKLTHIPIQWIYLIFDYGVLALSLSYIPLSRILYSVLTATLSSLGVGIVQRLGANKEKNNDPKSL